MQFFVGMLLGGLALLSVSLERTYRSVPVKELKRRARQDEFAYVLYRAVGYGHSLRVVLWFLIGLTSAAFFVYVARTAPVWFALASAVALIWLGFVWLPARQVTRFGRYLAARMAPVFSWLLYYIHPVIDTAVRFLRRHHPVVIHTGLYDKDDLIDLLERQQVQPDNRIEKAELEIALNALRVGERTVHDVLTPRRSVKAVNISDEVGPILMTELHDSGLSRFPVYEDRHDNIVGTLFLRDLVRTKSGGLVRDIMRKEVCYIHEDQSLVEALQAILKTRHHMFIVVNNFEEFVGIVSIEDVLEEIIGRPIIDEFDQYEDMRAVAARKAMLEHRAHKESTPALSSEVVE